MCISFFIPFHRTHAVEKLVCQVRSSDTPQFRFYFLLFFRLIPEEELSLGKFFPLCFSTEDRFQCVRVKSGIPSLSRYCHRSRGEVLYLFQVEVQAFGDNGKLRHIFFFASGM